MGLTVHQSEAAEKVLGLLEGNDMVLLKGSAGTGKTTVAGHIARILGNRVCASAPTNKAVSVLSSKMPGTEAMTVHTGLNLKHSYGENGELYFYVGDRDKPVFGSMPYVFVDEASMVDSRLLSLIRSGKGRSKVLFIGDEKQLNPVGEHNSPVFSLGIPEAVLSEIVRQSSENPIIALSNDLSLLKKRQDNVKGGRGYVFTRDSGKIIDTLAGSNGTSDFKYLSYTNGDVDNVNSIVRNVLYGNPDKVEKGETLVFGKPYGRSYKTSDEVKVESLELRPLKVPYVQKRLGKKVKQGSFDCQCYIINGSVLSLHEGSEKPFVKLRQQLHRSVKSGSLFWEDYHNFAGRFADLRYNHALTVHKSQGSTYRQVVINLGDIYLNRNPVERKRMLYTAVTRPEELVVVYDNF